MKQIPRNFSDFLANVFLVPDVHTGQPTNPVITPGTKAFLDYAFPSGGFRERDIGYWVKKKRLKSGVGGALAIHTAILYPNSEIVFSNSSYVSGLGRCYAAMVYSLKHSPLLNSHAEILKDTIRFDNDSFAHVVTAQAKSIAGHSARLTIIDESWSLSRDDWTRWEELVPLPVPNAARISLSYAGILGYSEILENQWNKAIAGDQPLANHPYVYHDREAGLIAAIEGNESFADWGNPTAEMLAKIEKNTRPYEFVRLWKNEWSSGKGLPLLEESDYQALVDPGLRSLDPLHDSRICYAGLDIGVSRASSGLVLMNPNGDFIDLIRSVEYAPNMGTGAKKEVDIAEIEADIIKLYDNGSLKALAYDPREASYLIQRLKKKIPRLELIKLEQNSARYRTDAQLVDAIRERLIRIPDHFADLKTHFLNTELIVNKNGTRIDRASRGRPNDLTVAAAMALDLCLARSIFKPAPIRAYEGNVFYGSAADSEMGRAMGLSTDSDLDTDSVNPEILQPDSPDSILARQAKTKIKHSKGIHWWNCRLRNKGCSACERELREGGFFTTRDPDKWLAENRNKG